jgi:hypothetical protein
MEKNKIGGACSSDGEGRGVYRLLVGESEGKRPPGDLDIDGMVILGWIFRKWDMGGMNWIELAQDRDR